MAKNRFEKLEKATDLSTIKTKKWLEFLEIVVKEEKFLAQNKEDFIKRVDKRMLLLYSSENPEQKLYEKEKRKFFGTENEIIITKGGVTFPKAFLNIYWNKN